MAIQATSVWRVRAAGSNTNGAGYDASISGAGTDYSQQNSAQLTHVDGVGNGTTTFTSVLGSFTSAMVGNAVYISGGTLTTGWYFIITYNSATSVVLDRSPGAGTGGTYAVGGAWADPFGSHVTSTGPLVPGNIVYIRGSGTDNPTVADYTTSGYRIPQAGGAAGYIKFIGENGRPRLEGDGMIFYGSEGIWFENLYFSVTAANFAGYGIIQCNGNTICQMVNCVIDQSGQDIIGVTISGDMTGCEVLSRTSNTGAAGSFAGIVPTSFGDLVNYCNIHNCWGDGLSLDNTVMFTVINTIVSSCAGNGARLSGTTTGRANRIAYCTIDGNKGHGISVAGTTSLLVWSGFGNLITNHTQAGKYGINVEAGTTAANDLAKSMWDGNWLYNNTGHYNAISGGPNDVTGTDPLYTNQATQDYTLQSSSPVIGAGYPTRCNPASPVGASPAARTTLQKYFLRRSQAPNVESYIDMGAVQRIMSTGGGGGMLVNPGMGGGARG